MQVLCLFFPFPHIIPCCETGCRTSCGGATCISQRQSLVRHLEQEHDIRITKCNKCSLCGAELSLRPSRHAWFAGGSLEAPATRARHRCPHCEASFTSVRVLSSHVKWHEKQDAMLRAAPRRPPPAAALPVARVDDRAASPGEQGESPTKSLTSSEPGPIVWVALYSAV
ncbi:hypothetical protein HPB49_019980 [Dermacentor silvarum]|uniref:Uncharacterized protein n=1 Tax=Dermacentor silvarum TaxID=543639 RepID=A0ACB8CME1_DERSI|nr:hypothetical protein HPB49_019980 [Dermacentor silvarum]